jgi:hypothetical protein
MKPWLERADGYARRGNKQAWEAMLGGALLCLLNLVLGALTAVLARRAPVFWAFLVVVGLFDLACCLWAGFWLWRVKPNSNDDRQFQ